MFAQTDIQYNEWQRIQIQKLSSRETSEQENGLVLPNDSRAEKKTV